MKKYSFLRTLFMFSFIILFTGCGGVLTTSENDIIDAITFKTEYENENNNKYYLEINKNNSFKYLTDDNVDDVLSGSSIIFIGYPTSNVSRASLNILLSISTDFDINKIYYFNNDINIASYKVDNDKVEVVKDSSDLYKKIVNKFNEYLDNDITIDDKKYNVSEKIINAPVIAFIKNGEIIGYYDDFGKINNDEFLGFDDDKLNYIKNNLYNLIAKYEE